MAARALLQHPLIRRLPLLLVALAGIWLWRSDGADRQIVWQLPPPREDVERLEIQLRREDGDLVKREAFFFQAGKAPPEVVQTLRLSEGTYAAQVFVERTTAQDQVLEVEVPVRGDFSVVRLR